MRTRLGAVAVVAGGIAGAPLADAAAQSYNPGRDYNQRLYERRYDPGVPSSPPYYRQNPGQQYNNRLYERRYRVAPRPEARDDRPQAQGENSPRVRSIKPSRKTDEQARRAARGRSDDD